MLNPKNTFLDCPSWAGAIAAAFCVAISNPVAWAWGTDGHKTVGAIADDLIVGSHAEQHVKTLLGTESLQDASTWADEVKHGPFTKETKAYAARNHDHKANHYADIPIQKSAYSASFIGANKNDVVHTIVRCIKVLESGKDDPTITQKEALMVLVHMVGDVHQPLHVGSVYLDATGKIVEPKTPAEAAAAFTTGGNDVSFHGVLHSYWDDQTVSRAFTMEKVATPKAFADKVSKTSPAGVQTGSFMSQWSGQWASSMMPLAAKAYDLKYEAKTSKVEKVHGKMTTVTYWPATATDVKTYDSWAGQVAHDNLVLAGFRLAAVLKKIWP
ncbi:MAG: S1/P1 nuclease [Chthoniobacter sp.]|uniref:S1/P1 nuclease n=1 Tax=Chthoniobacter sp. TaxID=2510640 RepID=UPI0032AD16CD